MARIIECVPNCSEGRNKEVIEYIADAVRSVPGVALMDYSSDENHNRSVFTIVGDPDQMGEAAFRFAKACVEKIDMTKHHGEHPRMGAVDVIPFTPVKDVSMEECVELSKKVGQRIWEELKMPVTLYEESATAPHRRNLAAIRKGQFEGMPEKLQDPKWYPDYGNHEIHPTAGIVAVGAVIRGGTPHFDFVAAEATKGLAHVSLESGVPVGFGLLTTDNIEQAIERAGTKAGNKGVEAASAVLETVRVLQQI